MTLISLLFVLILEYFFKISAIFEEQFKYHNWFPAWRKWLGNKVQQNWFRDWPGIAIIIGTPVLLLYNLVSDADKGFLFWLMQFALTLIVLVYCLGPIDQNEHLSEYFDAMESGDFQSAYHHVECHLDLKSTQDIPENFEELGRVVTTLILSQSNFRFFGVLVYFVLLGPAGALLYRLTCTFEFSSRDDDNSPYRLRLLQLRNLLDWLPARITGFLYALAGDFNGAMSSLNQYLFQPDNNDSLLEETGLGALGINDEVSDDVIIADTVEENNQALSLVSRSLTIFLVIIAMMTVFGWLS